MKTKIKLLLLLGLISVKVFSQNPESAGFQIPNFAAKSPEAAAFLKYGEYPVDLSTGLPNISIPLYTIEDGGISIPITLNYHASGIKVSQESSWVGLGWNLNYGAQIILSVRDDVDENNAQVDNVPSDATLDYYNQHPYMFNGGPIVSEQLDKSRVKDVYFFSSPTVNGQFYIKNGVPIVYPPDAFKVSTNAIVDGINASFIVTDPAGNVYLFATKEKSWRQQTHSAYYDSAWFVDRIITPAKQNIDFVYEDDGVLEDYSINQEINIMERATSCGCTVGEGYRLENIITPISTRGGTTYTFAKKIKEIIFDGGNSKVIFNRVNGREDLKTGTVPGNNVASYSTSRLNTVEIRHKKNSSSTIFDFVKGYQFLYTYFNPTAPGLFAYKSKRLKLTQVLDLIDGDGHEFAYSDKIVPRKDSYSQDYYGYNNGVNNVDLIPKTEITEPYMTTIGNANRGVSQSSIQAGILTGIRYPTKGWTKFIYENNDYFKFAGYVGAPTIIEAMSGGYHPESSGTLTFTQDFTIADLYDDSATISWYVRDNLPPEQDHLLSHQYIKVKLYKIVGEGPLLLVDETETRNGLPYVDQYVNDIELLGNGNYRIVIERKGANLMGAAFLTYKKNVYIVDNPLAAGLRIASIENRDFDDALQSKKVYTYKLPDDSAKSSGKLINNNLGLDFTTEYFKNFSNVGVCPQDFGSALFPKVDYEITQGYSSNSKYGIDGNAIIYQYVREQTVNFNGITNGSTLYKFNTEADLQIHPSLLISTSWKRGKVLEKTEFKLMGNTEYPVRKEINTYIEDNTKIASITGFKMRRFAFVPIVEDPGGPDIVPFNLIVDCKMPSTSNVTMLFYKYNIGIPWYYLKSTQITESFYNQANTLTGTLVTSKTYNYNNPLHMQLSSEVVSGAGITRETRYYYPHDAEVASEPGVATLKTKNRINTPLKTQTYEGSQKLSEQKTLYKDWGNGILLPEIVQAAKGTGELENRIIYNAVDNTNGKPLEMQLANGTKVCYIWGYNKSVPVVKIENSPAYSSIPSNLITAIQTATNTWATDATIYTLMDNLRNSPSLAGSMVTTYTYIPLKGVSSITDAKGDRTTYSYDGQGRLLFVKDKLGRILSSNEYHYKS